MKSDSRMQSNLMTDPGLVGQELKAAACMERERERESQHGGHACELLAMRLATGSEAAHSPLWV